MSCESKMSLAALAARFTWSLIRRCNDEWTCSSRLEACPKLTKVVLFEKHPQIKSIMLHKREFLFVWCFLSCSAMKQQSIWWCTCSLGSHISGTCFFWLGRCSSTVAVAFLLQGVGNVLPQLSGKDSGPLQSSPESNFASGQFIRRITLARHSL